MKPIKLEIEGLHSFEANQVIDFNTLSSRGVFGIFGATGSGKSTILDAIVLALYGKVHRSKSNSDFINLKSKKAIVVFEFGFSENGKQKTYSIRRVFKRKPKNPNEVEQSAEICEVGAFGSRQLMEGVNKVDEFVNNLLGMSDVEFLKCIALPQGEFSAFLKAKPNERVSIIGNIFDLNKYGQELWDKVKSRTENLEKDLAVLEGQISVVGEVDKDVLASDTIKLQTLGEQERVKREKLETLLKLEKEERDVAELGIELDAVDKKLKDCEKNKKDIEIKKEIVGKAQKVYENSFVLSRAEQLTSQLLKDEEELYKKNEILDIQKTRGNDIYCNAVQELEELKGSLKNSIEKIERLKALKNVEAKNETIKSSLALLEQDLLIEQNKVLSLEKKLTDSRVSKSMILSEQNEVEQEIELIKENLKDYQAILSYNSLQKFIEELKNYRYYVEEKHAEAVNVLSLSIKKQEKLLENKKSLTSNIKALHKKAGLKGMLIEGRMTEVLNSAYLEKIEFLKFKSKIENIVSERVENDKLLKSENALKIRLEREKLQLDTKFNSQIEEIKEIESKISELRKSKELIIAQNGVSGVIEDIRIGDICPICSNEVLKKTIPDQIDVMVIDNEIFELESVLSRKNEAKNSVIFAIAKLVSNIESCENRIKEIEEKQIELRSEARVMIENLTNEVVLDEIAELYKIELSLDGKVAQALEFVEKDKSLFAELREVELNLTKQNCINASARLDIENNSKLLNSISDSIKEKDLALLSLVSENENIEEKISEMEQLNIALDGKLKEKEILIKKHSEIDANISKLEAEMAFVNKTIDKILYDKSEAEYELKSNQILIDAESVSDGVAKAIVLEEEQLNCYQHRISELMTIQDETSKDINIIESEIKSLESLRNAHIEEHNQLKDSLKNLFTSINVKSIQEAKLFVLSEKEMKVLNSEIEEFSKNIAIIQSRKQELENVLNGRVSSPVILEQIRNQIESLSVEKEIIDKEILELGFDLKNRQEKLELNQKLKSDYKKIEKEYVVAKDLYEVLRGKALLEFIAEEFINDISFMASNKLQVLMDGRYVLKYQNREFIVVDNFNDACERPVSTLSGGEVFVVSLALALSISDSIASKSNKNIDFFFLDEGFGTLDKEYCEYVVDSLIKLESQNLTIGLISHIPELQEKIINKLEIIKTANGSIVKKQFDI